VLALLLQLGGFEGLTQEFEHHAAVDSVRSRVGKVVEQRDDMTPARMGGVGITDFEQDRCGDGLPLRVHRHDDLQSHIALLTGEG
jgi:hypothetical protein